MEDWIGKHEQLIGKAGELDVNGMVLMADKPKKKKNEFILFS